MVYDFDKIYFAVKKEVVGYFRIEEANDVLQEIEWAAVTWRNLRKRIPTKPFRGFRYKWW